MSFGVFTPTKASTPQKTRMVKMMAKSLMSFRTCGEGSHLLRFPFVKTKSVQKKKKSVSRRRKHPEGGPKAHRGGEEAARLELLQSHGAGVGPEEQDEGHQGDVRHVSTGLPHQNPLVLPTLVPGQSGPGGVLRLQEQGHNNVNANNDNILCTARCAQNVQHGNTCNQNDEKKCANKYQRITKTNTRRYFFPPILNTTNSRKEQTYHIRAVKPGRRIGKCRSVAYHKKKKPQNTTVNTSRICCSFTLLGIFKSTVILFSSPGCPFATRKQPRLRKQTRLSAGDH